MLSIDVGPYTLAEVMRIAKHKRTEMWDHTAPIILLLHNANAKKKDRKRLEDIHPYRTRQQMRPQETISLSELRDKAGGKVPWQ